MFSFLAFTHFPTACLTAERNKKKSGDTRRGVIGWTNISNLVGNSNEGTLRDPPIFERVDRSGDLSRLKDKIDMRVRRSRDLCSWPWKFVEFLAVEFAWELEWSKETVRWVCLSFIITEVRIQSGAYTGRSRLVWEAMERSRRFSHTPYCRYSCFS